MTEKMAQIHRSRPKEVFLHLLNIITLYIAAGSLITVFFQIINFYLPYPTEYNYGGEFHGAGLVRGAVAALLVVFPVYIGVSIFLKKLYRVEPEIKLMRVRRWLLNLTLFLTALIVIGDLISLVWNFLNGELTLRFILKIFSILAVASAVFIYYLLDLRDSKDYDKFLKIFGKVVIVVVAVSVACSFLIIGSPLKSRQRSNDQIRVSNLSEIQGHVIGYWQAKGALPDNLDQLNDPTRYVSVPVDPITKQPYVYRVKGDLSFELCANFETSNNYQSSPAEPVSIAPYTVPRMPPDNNWSHGEGESCFARMIDPDFYPPVKMPLR